MSYGSSSPAGKQGPQSWICVSGFQCRHQLRFCLGRKRRKSKRLVLNRSSQAPQCGSLSVWEIATWLTSSSSSSIRSLLGEDDLLLALAGLGLCVGAASCSSPSRSSAVPPFGCTLHPHHLFPWSTLLLPFFQSSVIPSLSRRDCPTCFFVSTTRHHSKQYWIQP